MNLSAAQVYRLVTEVPERLSLPTLAALCDIFGCTPSDVVEPYVQATSHTRAAGDTTTAPPATDLHPSLRPTRARIVDTNRD